MTDPLAEGYLPCPLVEGQDLSQPFAAAGEGMNCSIQQDSILGSFLLGKVLVNLITVDCFILVGQTIGHLLFVREELTFELHLLSVSPSY